MYILLRKRKKCVKTEDNKWQTESRHYNYTKNSPHITIIVSTIQLNKQINYSCK